MSVIVKVDDVVMMRQVMRRGVLLNREKFSEIADEAFVGSRFEYAELELVTLPIKQRLGPDGSRTSAVFRVGDEMFMLVMDITPL